MRCESLHPPRSSSLDSLATARLTGCARPISTKLQIEASFDVPAAMPCMTRLLGETAAARHVHFTRGGPQAIALHRPRTRDRSANLGHGNSHRLPGPSVRAYGRGLGRLPAVYWSWPTIFLDMIWSAGGVERCSSRLRMSVNRSPATTLRPPQSLHSFICTHSLILDCSSCGGARLPTFSSLRRARGRPVCPCA